MYAINAKIPSKAITPTSDRFAEEPAVTGTVGGACMIVVVCVDGSTGTGAGGSIIFQTADGAGSSGSGSNSLATAMTILDNGNVGIGVSDPDQKLHIQTDTVGEDVSLLIRN